MKQTPEEKKIYDRFLPGRISKDGFLGKDTRHIHDIIESDIRVLERLGVTQEEIANRLQYFLSEGKRGLESEVDLGDWIVQVRWTRGMMPCPFGEPGLHAKIVTTVLNKSLKRKIRYSQLSVHMILKHGFFGGKGSVFRVKPDEVVDVLKIKQGFELKKVAEDKKN